MKVHMSMNAMEAILNLNRKSLQIRLNVTYMNNACKENKYAHILFCFEN